MTTSYKTKLSKNEHVAMLKQAIAASLSARIEHDQQQEQRFATSGADCELQVISAADLMEADPDQLFLESIIGDPIRRALRTQLKDLGWRLFRLLGSTDEMRAVAENVADLKPGHWGRRIDIIDKAWTASAMIETSG